MQLLCASMAGECAYGMALPSCVLNDTCAWAILTGPWLLNDQGTFIICPCLCSKALAKLNCPCDLQGSAYHSLFQRQARPALMACRVGFQLVPSLPAPPPSSLMCPLFPSSIHADPAILLSSEVLKRLDAKIAEAGLCPQLGPFVVPAVPSSAAVTGQEQGVGEEEQPEPASQQQKDATGAEEPASQAPGPATDAPAHEEEEAGAGLSTGEVQLPGQAGLTAVAALRAPDIPQAQLLPGSQEDEERGDGDEQEEGVGEDEWEKADDGRSTCSSSDME